MKVLVVSRSPRRAQLPETASEDSKVIHPGSSMIGEGFDVIVLRTEPKTDAEQEWFDNLPTRLYPDGVIV